MLRIKKFYHLTVFILTASSVIYTHSVMAQGSMTMMDLPPIDIQQAPSCEIQAPDGGEYQYAQLHASMFHPQRTTALPAMTKRWSVICDAPASLVLEVKDLQQNSAPTDDRTQFGLGTVNGNGKLGQYQITLNNAAVDNKAVSLYETNDASVIGSLSSQFIVSADKNYGWAGSDHKMSSGKVFSADITVSPVLNSLQLTQGPLIHGAELNGMAEMIFSFGI